ncbi:MAG: DEAD/DEAH box helicase family protein [Uliginosibacterium sp.]|nr:DEAD/DEAH box helicase family protein [Uliginosibacterium sp.]
MKTTLTSQMKRLREYQETGLNKALSLTDKRIIIQLATGGGKTVIMSHHVIKLIDKYKALGKRVLVIADRAKLISQIRETFQENGIWIQQFGTSTKTAHSHVWCYICTSQLAYSRLKKNKDFFMDVGAVICDEAHVTTHNSAIDILANAFDCDVIGYTATPIYSGKKNISEYFQNICCIADVPDLVDMNFLVKPKTYCVRISESDMKTLDEDKKKGDFTEKSLLALFSNNEKLDMLYKSYTDFSRGRTIVFCSSCAHCEITSEFLRSKGLEVSIVTSKQTEDEIKTAYQWIKETPRGVLVSVDMLTKGYDEPTLETVIMFRSTKSLALLMQCFGRGGRLCPEIGKKEWACIDLGNNILNADGTMNLGKWEHRRDWRTLFLNKSKPSYPPQKICPVCFECIDKNIEVCSCGHVFVPEAKEQKQDSIPKDNKGANVQYVIAEIIDEVIEKKSVISGIVDKYNSANYKPHWAAFKLLGEICKAAKGKAENPHEDENIINACLENFAKNIPKITENIQGVKVFSPKGKFWKDKAVEYLSN